MLHQPINTDKEISKAKKYIKSGKIDQAKKTYQNILSKFPKNLRAKNGLDNIENCNKEDSKKYPEIKLKLDEIVNLYNEKKFTEALELALDLYTSEYDNYLLCNILGAINSMLILPEKAEYYYKKCIDINPNYLNGYNNLGTCYRGWQKYELAIDTFKKAITLNPESSQAYNNLGLVYKDLKQYEKSLECLEKSIQINGKNVLAINNIGLIYRKLKNYEKATFYFNRCIDIQENYYEAYVNRATVKNDKGEFKSAIVDLKKAIELNPISPQAYNNLGSTYNDLGYPIEAEKCFKKSIEIKPNDPENHTNLGVAYEYMGNHTDANFYFEKALEIDKNYHNASSFLAFQYFQDGDYTKFQKKYKYRMLQDKEFNFIELKHSKSYLEIKDLKDKHILAYDEQGIGDEINFIGLLPLFMKKISKNISIVCSERLLDIYKFSFPNIPIYTRKEVKSLDLSFDCEMPIGSFLELIDLKNEDDFPLDSYLKTPPLVTEYWKKMLSNIFDGKKIGISWRGGATPSQQLKRSLNLTELMKNLPENGNYISLQYGGCEDEIEEAEKNTGRKIIHFSDIDPTKELNNQLSIVSNLDHIISIQSSTVHFAGALGIPLTGLISVSPDFRYGRDSEKSKMYKSVNFIRQHKIGEWDSVFNNLNNNFANFFNN